MVGRLQTTGGICTQAKKSSFLIGRMVLTNQNTMTSQLMCKCPAEENGTRLMISVYKEKSSALESVRVTMNVRSRPERRPTPFVQPVLAKMAFTVTTTSVQWLPLCRSVLIHIASESLMVTAMLVAKVRPSVPTDISGAWTTTLIANESATGMLIQ